MSEEETKATEKKEEAPTPPKAQMTAPPTGPGGALEEIQKRAVGGKVAVLEKGDKEPKIVGGNGEGEAHPEEETENAAGEAEAKAPNAPSGPPGIPISPDAAEDLKMVMDEIGQLERQAGQNAIQFHSAMKQIEEKASELRTDFNSIVRRLGKRFNVPQGWVLNLDTMSFVPQQQGAGQMGMPPLQ